MPVPVQTPAIAYTANGVTTIFAFPFMVFSAVDLQVRIDDELKVLNVHYTVTGVGVEAGGSVVFVDAPATGANISILRQLPLGRDTEYQYSGDFQAQTVNRDFDRLWMALQDVDQDSSRALRLPPGDPASTLLPILSQRANRGLAFDGDGNAVPAPSSDATSLGAMLGDTTSSANGAALIGYKLNAPGAVGRTLQSKLYDVISVKDFGAKGDGVTNDTAAFQAAFTFASLNSRLIYIPAGIYEITSTITAGATVRGMYGEGRGATIVNFAIDVNGFYFSFTAPNQFFSASDMSIQTHGKSGVALTLDYSARLVNFPGYDTRFHVENITFQGATGDQGTGWDFGLDSLGGSNSSVTNCDFIGFGSDDAHYPVRFPSKVAFRFRGSGPQDLNLKPVANVVERCWVTHAVSAVQFSGMEGGFVSHCNFIEIDFGIRWTAGDVVRPELAATDNHINCYQGGIVADGLAQCTIKGNLIYRIHLTTSVVTGISATRTSTGQDCVALCITGNTFVDSGASGGSLMDAIALDSCIGGVITDNIFQTVRNGIFLGPNCNGVIVGGTNKPMFVEGAFLIDSGVDTIDQTGTALNPGYQKFAGRGQLKWGTQIIELNASGDAVIPLSPAYKDTLLMAMVNNADPTSYGSAGFSVSMVDSTNAGIKFSVRPNPGAVPVRVGWMAMGH